MKENENLVYCDFCGKLVPYEIRTHKSSCRVKNTVVDFDEKVAFCSFCHEEVWVYGLEDDNIRASRNAYCRHEQLITADDIENLLKKYNIGAKPLARLLGWGEVTILRFLDGCIPSELYSEKLKSLLNSEDEFYALAEKNRDRITEAAYNKIKKRRESEQDVLSLGSCNVSALYEPDVKVVYDLSPVYAVTESLQIVDWLKPARLSRKALKSFRVMNEAENTDFEITSDLFRDKSGVGSKLKKRRV